LIPLFLGWPWPAALWLVYVVKVQWPIGMMAKKRIYALEVQLLEIIKMLKAKKKKSKLQTWNLFVFSLAQQVIF